MSASIECTGIGKAYRIGAREERADTLAASMLHGMTAPFRNLRRLRGLDVSRSKQGASIVWALRDISFTVEPGEVVGFVGRNGAGKSTLLKILSQITPPTTGNAAIRGRVSSLLEVGTGFHPELSGRENIFMNGTILGMSRAEIRAKFDEIVAFSGVERFLDTPVKRYSSGMKVRLGFAVAAHLEPEILIVDEVLAVGDAEFQKKCLGKMETVASGGRTVLFVSHNMGAIQNLCTRAIALRGGEMTDDGQPAEVVQKYLADLVPPESGSFALDNPERRMTGELYLTDGYILGSDGSPTSHLTAGEEATFVFQYENPLDLGRVNMKLEIRNSSGVVVHFLNAADSGFDLQTNRRGTIHCRLPRLSLPIGDYSVRTTMGSRGKRLDMIPNALSFDVVASTFFNGRAGPNSRLAAALAEQVWSAHDVSQEASQMGQEGVA